MSEITTFRETCKGMEDCGICALVCPKDIFHPSKEMNARGYVPPALQHEDECIGCLNCMIYCPDMAIVVVKDEKQSEGAHE